MLLKKLFNWFVGLFKHKKPIVENADYRLVIVSELPEFLSERVVYVEGNENSEDYWYALLKCPCGCEDNIMLNLIDDVNPYWKVSFNKLDFSINPSIRRTKKCKSHFWLRNKKIIWV